MLIVHIDRYTYVYYIQRKSIEFMDFKNARGFLLFDVVVVYSSSFSKRKRCTLYTRVFVYELLLLSIKYVLWWNWLRVLFSFFSFSVSVSVRFKTLRREHVCMCACVCVCVYVMMVSVGYWWIMCKKGWTHKIRMNSIIHLADNQCCSCYINVFSYFMLLAMAHSGFFSRFSYCCF